jgi:hypothetical protein
VDARSVSHRLLRHFRLPSSFPNVGGEGGEVHADDALVMLAYFPEGISQVRLGGMNQRTLAATVVATGLIAGCGSDASQPTTAARSLPAKTATATTSDPAFDASYRSDYALALLGSYADAAKYCERKLGATIGSEAPPSAGLREGKTQLIRNAKSAVRDVPDLIVNDKPLSEFLQTAADTMSTGQCDAKAADTLQDLAIKARR